MKKLTAIAFLMIYLIVSTSFAFAQYSSVREETGESIIVEAFDYNPDVVRVGILEDQKNIPVQVSLRGTTLGMALTGSQGPEAAPFTSNPKIRTVIIQPLEKNPLINDIRYYKPVAGYNTDLGGRAIDLGNLVVLLKKINSEKEIFPEAGKKLAKQDAVSLDAKLKAIIDYESETAPFGLGSQSLALPVYADNKVWEEAIKNTELGYTSLFYGNLYLRALNLNPTQQTARFGVYTQDTTALPSTSAPQFRQIASAELEIGKESQPIRIPVTYEDMPQEWFRIRLDNIEAPQDMAFIKYDGNFQLLKSGQKIENSNYWIEKIDKDRESITLTNGRNRITLTLPRISPVSYAPVKINLAPIESSGLTDLKATVLNLKKVPGAIEAIE